MFSAIVTTFLIRALDDLAPNYQQQSAILLYQILNGRDPNPGNIPNPLAPFRASGISVAVNCLWFASLSASLGASFGAMICKEWLTDYDGGTSPVVNLIRACRRHTRFVAFHKWGVHTFIGLLPPLLHSSVFLFFTGAVVYLWKVDKRVAIMYQTMGGLFALLYFVSTFLPFIIRPPFRPYSTRLFHRLSVRIGKVVMPIVDVFVYGGYLTLRHLANTVLWPLARTVIDDQTLRRWSPRAQTILPGEYKHLRVGWENSFDDSLDEIDTSQRVQEEAILWLSQMPLDPNASKPVVSSLALISSSRPHSFPETVTVFLNMTLESSFREEPTQDEVNTAIDRIRNESNAATSHVKESDEANTATNRAKDKVNTAIDCILVLGDIKFQSAVDRNSDRDYHVGGVPVTPLVAWAAQKFAEDAFQPGFTNPHFEGIRERLLAAAAWLSPVEVAEGVEENDEELKVLDRFHFIEKIKDMLERHIRGESPLDTKDLVKLIHGMHAYIPRDDYGITSSIFPFLRLLCQDYDSPWSEDETVLRAMINYALDLLLPTASRKPLVEREIEFEKLASELVDTLMATTGHHEVVAFGFWLVYRVPYAFKSRKTLLTDIARIWTLTNETIQEDHRAGMNLRAIDAFVAVAQLHAVATDELPKFTTRSALALVKGALAYEYSRPMGIYAMAMLLNLGTSTQVGALTNGIPAEPSRRSLFDVRGDLERNLPEEDVIDLHIYSALVVSKYPPVESDAGRVKELIRRMNKAIGEMSGAVEEMGGAVGNTVIGDPRVTRNSAVESSPGLDRVRWKAIYLSTLLFALVPEDEKRELPEGFETKVRTMSQDGGLPPVTDHTRCHQMLDVGILEPRAPEQGGPIHKAFEGWVNGFPLFPLAGSVTKTHKQ